MAAIEAAGEEQDPASVQVAGMIAVPLMCH
jgi:hypothetical protein